MKPIPGYEGLYTITPDGVVERNGNVIQQNIGKVGYPQLLLCKEGEIKHFTIHVLVALTYIPNPDNLPIVLHLDNNKLNNHFSNLKWGTHKENIQQAHRDGLCVGSEKQKKAVSDFAINKFSKSIMQLTKEGILCKVYKSAAEAQKITGFIHQRISHCANGKQKYYKGFEWKFLT